MNGILAEKFKYHNEINILGDKMELEEMIDEIAKFDRQKKKMLFRYLFETIDEQDIWDVVGDWAMDVVAENGYWDLGKKVS